MFIFNFSEMRERLAQSVLILIFGIGIINTIRPSDSKFEQTEYKRFWIEKTHNSSRFNLLVCGDSRVYRGVSSAVVAEEAGKDYRAFNYGYSSGSYSSFMLDQIEMKLDNDADSKVIMLGITPYSLTPKAILDEHIQEELARKKEEILEYKYLVPIKRIFEPMTLQQLFPKKDIDETAVVNAPVYHQEFYSRQGWVASWKIPSDSTSALTEYVRDFTNNKVSQVVEDSLIERVSTWTRHGIKVFAFRPPTTLAMVQLEDSISGFNQSRFVASLEQVGGRWIDIPVKGYISYDGSHLVKESALRLSRRLGEAIREE